ncbi:MAG: hypothetical protein ACK4TA_13900 [Saprospiraceae bacterium]
MADKGEWRCHDSSQRPATGYQKMEPQWNNTLVTNAKRLQV